MSNSRKTQIDFKSILALSAIFLLIGLSTLFWMEARRRFPALPAGHYLGKIGQMAVSEQSGDRYFYIERSERANSMTFTLLEGNATPQVFSIQAGSHDSAESLKPLVLENPERLQLIGSMVNPGYFVGTARSLTSGEQSEWKLWKVSIGNQEQNSLALLELRQRLILLDELQSTEQRLNLTKERVAAQREEIQRLGDVITEGESLKTEGESQFEMVNQQREQVETQLTKLRAEAKELKQKLDIAQKLTRGGKLVSLARQITERENRWIDSLARTQLSSRSAEMQDSIERGKKILEVKRLIQIEHQKISTLQQQETFDSPQIGSVPFEEEY